LKTPERHEKGSILPKPNHLSPCISYISYGADGDPRELGLDDGAHHLHHPADLPKPRR
jgi:hypothetical protein